MDDGRNFEASGSNRKAEQMVKYFFQSMNGGLTFVHAGTKEELEAKVKAELCGDKETVKERIKRSIEKAKKDLSEFEAKTFDDEGKKLQNDIAIAQLKKGLYDAQKEYDRVNELFGSDLVFFELTPIELKI